MRGIQRLAGAAVAGFLLLMTTVASAATVGYHYSDAGILGRDVNTLPAGSAFDITFEQSEASADPSLGNDFGDFQAALGPQVTVTDGFLTPLPNPPETWDTQMTAAVDTAFTWFDQPTLNLQSLTASGQVTADDLQFSPSGGEQSSADAMVYASVRFTLDTPTSVALTGSVMSEIATGYGGSALYLWTQVFDDDLGDFVDDQSVYEADLFDDAGVTNILETLGLEAGTYRLELSAGIGGNGFDFTSIDGEAGYNVALTIPEPGAGLVLGAAGLCVWSACRRGRRTVSAGP